MEYTLLIGDRSYSSWSLRGWLPFAAFDIPVRMQSNILYRAAFADDLAAFAPGLRSVPALKTPQGGLLPLEPAQRAMAQSLIAEMHSGFGALRSACPMNLRNAWAGFTPSAAVLADLARIEAIWATARDRAEGPFLFGAYTLADVFYAPIAMRIAGYGLPVSDRAQAYVAAHLNHPPLRQWRALGLSDGPEQPTYEMGLPRLPFPITPPEM